MKQPKSKLKTRLAKFSDTVKSYLSTQSRRQTTLFANSKYPVSFKPFFVYQGLAVVLLFALLASTFIPKPTINKSLVIQTAVVKQNTAIVAGGTPVQWTMLVKKSDITKQNYLAKLPKNARNIKISTISSTQAKDILKTKPQEQLSLKQRSAIAKSNQPKSFFVASLLDTISKYLKADLEAATQSVVQAVNPDVQTTSDATAVNLTPQALSPTETPAPEVFPAPTETPTPEQTPTETITPTTEIPPTEVPSSEITTPSEEPVVQPETPTETTPTPAPTEDYVKVDYETPAPVISEQETDTGKLVTVSSPAQTENKAPAVTSTAPAVIIVSAAAPEAAPEGASLAPEGRVVPTPEPAQSSSGNEAGGVTPAPEVTPVPEVTPTPEVIPVPEVAPAPETSAPAEAPAPEAAPAPESAPAPEVAPSIVSDLTSAVSTAFSHFFTSALSSNFIHFLTGAISEVVDQTPPPVLTTINITPLTARLTVGPSTGSGQATQQLTAETLDQNKQHIDSPINWASNNTAVATVDANGLVTPTGAGTADITASNEDAPLIDVAASTKIPEIFKVGEESKIKIKWKSNNNQDVAFHAYDTDNNGKLDYVEWTVPHLSTQTFEIIFISKAFQLDKDQSIISDIYDQVSTQDQNYATITDGQYIRVTFEQILDSTKDITIYARPSQVLSYQKTPPLAMSSGAEAGGIGPHSLAGTDRLSVDGRSHPASASHDLRNSIIQQTQKNSTSISEDVISSPLQRDVVRSTDNQLKYSKSKDLVKGLGLDSLFQGNDNIAHAADFPSIQVYPVYTDADGNVTEGPALDLVSDNINPDFSKITSDPPSPSGFGEAKKYRVLLTNLQTPTDVFDLKISGSVDFDYIVDPNCSIASDDPAYTVCTYTASGTFTPPAGVTSVSALVVAGGGGGGYGTGSGGGGGAGGVKYYGSESPNIASSYAVTAGTGYTVTVGAGGAANTNGGTSAFDAITTAGGGKGGYFSGGSPATGGSGGGGGGSQGASNGIGAAGTSGQGYAGGTSERSSYSWPGGAGGGGASEVGHDVTGIYWCSYDWGGNPGAGGNGLAYSISGSSVYYAGGGGGGLWNLYDATLACGGVSGAGGLGGGGQGSNYDNAPTDGVAGTANTGGGGGGSGYTTNAGAGGSGVVIVRYLTPTLLGTGLVAHYKLNDSVASTAVADSSGNGHNGIASTNTSGLTATGVINSAFNFASANDFHLDVTNTTAVGTAIGTGSLTYAFWAYASDWTALNYDVAMRADVSGGYTYINFNITNGNYLEWWYRHDKQVNWNFTGLATGWHHFVFTYDSVGQKSAIWVDNDKKNEVSSIAAYDMSSLTTLYFGSNESANGFWKDKLDDIRIYNKALSTDEIGELYNNGAGTEGDTIPTYTVTYDGNTNTGGTVPTDAGAYANGATVTVLGNTGTLVKTGYTFNNWNTAANGSGTSYAPAATFAMGSANVTLYAQWADTTNPTAGTVTAPASDTYQSSTSYTWTWGAGSDAGSGLHATTPYTLKLFTNSACTTGEVDKAGQTATNLTVTGLAEGTYYAKVTYEDAAGNTADSACSTYKVVIDSTNPTVTITSPTNNSYSQSTSVSFSASASDTNPGFLVPDLDSSLVSWWRFNGDATDSIGGHNGTLIGTAYATGKTGQALSLQGGGNQGVNLASGIAIDTSVADFSASAWVYRNISGGQDTIIDNTASHSIHFRIESDNYVYIGANHSTVIIPATTWTLITVVRTASTMDFYINGSSAGSFTGLGTVSGTYNAIGWIGGNNTWTMDGMLDEVMVFNRVLTADEVTALYNGTAISHSSTLTQASHTYQVYSEDLAGNIGTAGPNTFTVDATNPTSTISTPADNSYSTSTTVALTGTSSDTNLSATTISVDGGAYVATGGTAASWTYSATGLSQASHTFQSKATDLAGNTDTSALVHVTVDTTAPNAATSLGWSETSPHNSTSVTASWTKSNSGDLADQKIQFYSNAGCTITSGSLIDLSSNTLQTRAFTGVNGSTYAYKITSIDNATNEAVSACSSSMVIDITAPTVSTVTVQTGLTVDVAFSEAMGTGVTTASNYTVFGTGKGTLASNPNTVALVSGNTYRLTWTSGEMFNGGDITITVANAQDVAGNAVGSPNSGTHTSGGIGTAPTGYTVAIDQSYINNANKGAVSFTFTGAEVGTTYNYSFAGTSGTPVTGSGTISTGSDQISNVNLTGLGEGTVTLTAYLTDSAGNIGGNATSTKTKDTVVPTTSDNYGAKDDVWQSATQTITLTPTDASPSSGFAYTKYCVSSATCDPSAGTAYTAPVPIATENTSYFRYASSDSAGNTQTTVSRTVLIDTTKPTTLADGGTYLFGDTWTSDPVTVSFTCSDGGGSQCLATYYCTDSANTCTPSTPYATAVPVSTIGTSYIRYASVDNVSNSEATKSQTINISNVPATPTLTADTGNQITATWSANGNPAGTEYYAENTPSTGSGQATNSGWITATTWISTGLSCNTSYTFRVKARASGSTSETAWSSTVSETTKGCGGGGLPPGAYDKPVLPASVLINNGASTTSTRDVVLNITAGSNVARMSVSNDKDFTNATQEQFKDTKLWTLTDTQGAKTVYVKFFTSYGAASDTVSATITYNITSTAPNGLAVQLQNISNQVATIGRQIAGLFRNNNQTPQINYPSIAEAVPEQTPEALAHKLDIVKVKDFGELDISFLPTNLKDLVRKFPELASTLAKVGITKASDVKKLNGVRFSFPGLSDQANIPSNFIFARVGNNKIDLNIRVALTGTGAVVQSLNVIQNKPINLTVRPDAPASSVEGTIVLLPVSTPVSENNSSKEAAALLNSVLSGSQAQNQEIVLQKFEYKDENNDGVYTADIQAPDREGKYKIETTISYKDKNTPATQISIVAVVDPEGYVYENISRMQARVKDAIVSLYWLNPGSNKYEIWPAEDFQQENPQKTNETGKYSFLVPPGYYYITVKSTGYSDYKGPTFQVSQGSEVNSNIELVSKNWLARIFSLESILMVVIVLLFISTLVVLIYFLKRKK